MTYAKSIAEWGHYPPVNHNILINPSFTVQQRGDVIDHEGTKFFGPDRWRLRGVGGTGGTLSQSSTVIDPTTGTNKLVVKHRNATSESYTYQRIEAVNLQGLYGKEMTFSFSYSDTGGSGSPTVRIRSYDSLDVSKTLFDAIPTSLGNNRWTCTFTLSTDDGTFPDPSENGMQVLIYASEANAAPDEWSVWETKLEVGSVATPFIARSYGEELVLCQRYYQQFGEGVGAGNAVAGAGYNNRIAISSSILPVRMRANPTVTVIGNAYLAAWCGPAGQLVAGGDAGLILKADIHLDQVIARTGSIPRASIANYDATANTLITGGVYGNTQHFLGLEAEL